ncbi:hypothetical protein KY284_008141 [Solanum tuberosum]|nr:hypothetical protein KY284_008141 [Solanum tuberosum]
MQEQQSTSGAAQEGIIMKPAGVWCYKCRTCNDMFTSSQGLAGHQHKHISEGTLIKGEPQHKFFRLSADFDPSTFSWVNGSLTQPCYVAKGAFIIPVLRNGGWRVPVDFVAVHDSFMTNLNKTRQLVSYGVKLNHNATLLNKPVESINSSMRNTSICGQKELDLELRL